MFERKKITSTSNDLERHVDGVRKTWVKMEKAEETYNLSHLDDYPSRNDLLPALKKMKPEDLEDVIVRMKLLPGKNAIVEFEGTSASRLTVIDDVFWLGTILYH